MKKIVSLIISVIFIVLAINSTVYSQEESTKDTAFGAVNPQYRISDNPLLRLNETERNIPPIIPPTLRIVENMVDPEAVEIFNIATRQVTRVSSNDSTQRAVESDLNSTLPYQGLLPSSTIETVFPPDDRLQISSTTGYPWRTIVKLRITFPSGASGGCSGAIVDNFHVLSAGHCVYSSDDGGWATSIKVIPGLDDTYMPYNYAWVTYMRSYTGWTVDGDHRHDWSVVTLDRNVGGYTGWMGRMTATASWWYVDPIYTGILNTAGYPGDKGGETMWFDSDYGRTADDYNHWYYMDTYGGQSGSPVWRYDGTNRYILTVHAYGDDGSGSNHGTRLNQDKYDRINTWLAEDAPYPPTDYADLIDDGEAYSYFYPTTISPGGSFNVGNDVRNIGTASSGGFYVSYYASTNTIISTSDYLIGTAYVSSINPFTWGNSDWSGSFPSNIPPGTYYTGWIIDSGNDVAEFDESNNIAYKSSYQLTVTWPLYVSVSETPDPVTSGGTSQVTLHVTTTGGTPVSGASVSVSATGGSLNPISGLTNAAGYFNSTYTAPVVAAPTIYTISANASKTGYIDGLGSDNITVIVSDTTSPEVTNASANQSDIPDDTDNIPLWGETAQLNVTVTDDSDVASVTVNLSEIGGLAAKPMIHIGSNIYSATTNASAGTPPRVYNLTVNATDEYGNSNTSIRIQLKVMKNGDTKEDNKVNIGDALRLANNVSYPGNPKYVLSSIYVAEVTGDGKINIGDALRLANNVSYPGNPAYILK